MLLACPRRLHSQRTFVSFCLLLPFGATPLLAQWTSNPLSLPAPAFAGAAATATRDADLVTAGLGLSSNALEVWRFGGAEWAALPAPAVSPRQDVALAYDRVRGELVLFGGVATPLTAPQFFGETWVFAGSWQQRTPVASPTPRSNAGMVFDARRGRVVLFGGATGSGASNETFEWDGTNWQQIATATSPPPVAAPALAYDAAREEVALLVTGGGFWTYDGTDWRQPYATAPQLVSQRLGFDAARGRLVAHGAQVSAATTETWEDDGSGWQFATGAGPQPFGGEAFGFDPVQQALAWHGQLGTQLWLPQAVASAAPFGATCVDARRALELAPGSVPALGRTLRLQIARGGLADLAVGVLGQSRTLSGGVPLPTPVPLPNPSSCLLRVDPFALLLLPATDPAPWTLIVPNDAALLGITMQAQVLFVDALVQVADASNGLALRAGVAPTDATIVETFASAAARDAVASGDQWAAGVASPVGLGGDGRHGSFRAEGGVLLGNGVYLWSTDQQLVPGTQTLDGADATVTGGEFFFTDLVIPPNVTVRFAGSSPAKIHVRGRIDIRGTLDVSAPALDRTTFICRNPSPAQGDLARVGQPGGLGGPGGGAGGNGGDRVRFSQPNPTLNANGVNGRDVVVPAGHAYAATAVGTGGRGSPCNPANGVNPIQTVPPVFSNLYSLITAAGGGGGGYSQAGNVGNYVPGAVVFGPGTAVAGSTQFTLFPLPTPTPSSLSHFLIGGSGGGGGGSHPLGGVLLVTAGFPNDVWRAGGAGTGGGGAVLLRAGGDLVVTTTGSIRSKGGAGALWNGENFANPSLNPEPVFSTSTLPAAAASWGCPAPGGGGSGGSVLCQAHGNVMLDGPIDTSGGVGSHITGVFGTTSAVNVGDLRGGDGAPGFYRLESDTGVVVNTAANVPAFAAGSNSGALVDRDFVSGSRSVWFAAGAAELPFWRGYELTVEVAGQTFLFSDDPALAPPANGGGPVRVRFQSARMRPDGTIDDATIGPWRDYVAGRSDGFGIGHDRGNAVRFDLVIDTSAGGNSLVRELVVRYR